MSYSKRFFALIFVVAASLLTSCATDPGVAAYEYKTVMVIVDPNRTVLSPTLGRLQAEGWEIYKCNITHPLNNYHYYYSLRRPKAQFKPVP